jgi:HlyD family secretion protein
MKKTHRGFANFWHDIKAHKKLTIFIVLVILIGGYEMVRASKAGSTAPQYMIAPAILGNIVQTVSGTGQVTAANQLDVTSSASGAVTSIKVAVGDHVTKGQLLATIDDTNARNSLLSAQIQYAQLVEPPKSGDVTNSVNSVQKSYSDAMSSVRGAFTDLQTVIPGLNSLLYDQDGYLGTANSRYLTTSGASYRNTAGVSFDVAKNAYQSMLTEYAALPSSPATSTQKQIIADSHDMLVKVATALKDTQSAITYITANETQYQISGASTAKTDVASWLNLINSDVSSTGSSGNAIASAENSYSELVAGPDFLALQSSQLSLQQAQNTYNNYFVRAPFDGIVGRIPVSVYSTAGGSTVIATIVGDQKIANISLDEVDAAKVRAGQAATITFDAINNFTATGTVGQVDLVGTVSSGVVSYNVRILIDTRDERIRPGMSLNVTITTERKDNILTVPTAAVKTLNGQSYVQILDTSVLPQTATGNASGSATFRARGQMSSTTRTFGSTTRMFASTTVATMTNRNISMTVSSATAPRNVPVTTGLADDTNTEITGGLERGQFVVTRTVSGTSAATTATPSILGAFGGQRAGGAATTVRTGTAAGGNARFTGAVGR